VDRHDISYIADSRRIGDPSGYCLKSADPGCSHRGSTQVSSLKQQVALSFDSAVESTVAGTVAIQSTGLSQPTCTMDVCSKSSIDTDPRRGMADVFPP
jgi:hypothetical protein